MTGSGNNSTKNLYGILGLPLQLSGRHISAQQIRAAFRQALLVHHPDKTLNLDDTSNRHAADRSESSSTPQYSVDEICHARDVLVDPIKRREYDRGLAHGAALTDRTGGLSNGSLSTSEQVEVVDLDDMEYNQERQTWTRACRCGNAKAYEVSEEALTNAITLGYREISVGCDGCSLHVRVTFETADDIDDIDEVQHG